MNTSGSMNADAFARLYQRLLEIDFFGRAGEALPPRSALARAVNDGANMLPFEYLHGYAEPLERNLGRLLYRAQAFGPPYLMPLEVLTGSVYQHRNGSSSPRPLNRFLAVISDLYRSFLDKAKRKAADVPIVQTVPPLAMFLHDGQSGPLTLPNDKVKEEIGVRIGAVALPATYADHPLTWAALAHETGGHDVTHADPGLLPELEAKVATALAGMPTPRGISRDLLAQLWAYWMDEASADVYGLLNIGPSMAANLAVFFAAFGAQQERRGRPHAPSLRMESRFDPRDPMAVLDPHPTTILRLHLLAGVVDTLTGLSQESRDRYGHMIDDLASKLATGSYVTITGNIPSPFNPTWIDVRVPLAEMQQTARNAGGFIATARLAALGGRSIQDIETWDNSDETRAIDVKNAVLAGRPIANLGDDAQLLAGVTLALLERPELYDAATQALNDGLDLSFRNDPIWGAPQPEAISMIYDAYPPGEHHERRAPEHEPAV